MLDNTCPAQLPELKDVAGWSVGGLDLVRLIDRKGKAVMEFSEVESGIFEAQRPGEGVFLLQTAAAAAAATAGISLDQMAGDWNVVRGASKTVCTITLTNSAAGADTFALKLKPGCDSFVTRFGPASWTMERGELVLKSKAGRSVWRFAADDPTNWQRIPEGSEPVSLVRQYVRPVRPRAQKERPHLRSHDPVEGPSKSLTVPFLRPDLRPPERCA